MGVLLYTGGGAGTATIKGERFDLTGRRCFSPTRWMLRGLDLTRVDALLDSGAFTDPPERRLSVGDALDRQLEWERRAAEKCGVPDWRVSALVAYDRLVDETWESGERFKRRWSVGDADRAVAETIEAARFLASHRRILAPRALVLPAQGVDSRQYAECAREVLRYAEPGDWFGLGGWCILGRNRRMLPEFWRSLRTCLPMAAAVGVRHVHLFGVLWQPALGGLLWLADRHGLTVSTDSGAPVLAATWADPKRAGMRGICWRTNVAWWESALRGLRESEHYREPPRPARQLGLFDA